MNGDRNVRGGFVLLALGLILGLAMSLYAFVPMIPVPAALDAYDDLPRRLLRLGHIAAIMLPLINIVAGPWIGRLALSGRAQEAASRLLLWGGAGLPATLMVEALSPLARTLHLSGPPAIAFVAGVCLLGWGARRMTGDGSGGGAGALPI